MKKKGGKVADLDDCDGTFDKGKFGDVTVPSGSTCTLNGTKVSGNIKVEGGGVLIVTDAKVKGNIQVEEDGALDAEGVKVKGNIQTQEATDVRIVGAKVTGNVQVEATSGTPPGGGSNLVCDSDIKSNLQVTKNTAPIELGCAEGNKVGGNLQVQDNEIPGSAGQDAIAVTNNRVKGNLQFQDNQSSSGDFYISDNYVKQDLQCDDNSPAPTGSGNSVKDDAEGQCAGLTGL